MTSDAPLRVLFVHHAEMVGGAAASLRCLLDHLPAESVRSVLLSPTVGLASPLSAPGLETHLPAPWWDVRLSANPLALLGQARSLAALTACIQRAASEHHPDLIHANTWPAALAATRAGLRIPILWHVRDVRLRPIITSALRGRCQGQIAISRFVAGFLASRGFAADRTHLVYNGVDVERFVARRSRADMRQELRIPLDAPVICSIARPAPWKEQGLLLEAASGVLREYPEARFVFVGAWGPRERREMERLRAAAEYLGIAHRSSFLGHRNDVPDLLRACDVFWHGAADEPLGRVVLEAMWMGAPVVAVNSGGPAELVEDGRSGILAGPGDAPGLARAACRMIAEPGFAAGCARAARERVLERFTAQIMARETLGVYRRLGGLAP